MKHNIFTMPTYKVKQRESGIVIGNSQRPYSNFEKV